MTDQTWPAADALVSVASPDEIATRRQRKLAVAQQEAREELIRSTATAPLLERIAVLEAEIADLAADERTHGDSEHLAPVTRSLVRYRRMYRSTRAKVNQLERALADATGSPIPPLETPTVRRMAAVFAHAVRQQAKIVRTQPEQVYEITESQLERLVVTPPVRNL